MSNEKSEPLAGFTSEGGEGLFAYVVKPFTGEVVKVCSFPQIKNKYKRSFILHLFFRNLANLASCSRDL